MIYRVIAYGLLLIVAAITFWLTKHLGPDNQPVLAANPHVPDYWSKDFKLTEMNADGSPKQTLVSERLTHYDDNDTTYLKKPILTLFDPQTPAWVIQSEMGNMSANGKHINLDGNVVVDRAATETTSAIKITTRNLRIQPEIEYAETDEAAEITSHPQRISGIGMQAYFTKDALRLSLLTNVRGKYEFK